jgi:hypothetical protein
MSQGTKLMLPDFGWQECECILVPVLNGLRVHFSGSFSELILQLKNTLLVSSGPTPEWQMAVAILQPCVPRQPPLEEYLLSSGHLLSLYALLLKRLPSCRDIREEATVLCNLVDWLTVIKPT